MSEPVGTFKTGNTAWTVYVQNHSFKAVAPGFTEVWGDSWDEMEGRAKVAASKAKVKVAVPYVLVSWTGSGENRKPVFVHRTATGLHAGSGNVLYTDGSGSGQETYSIGRRGFLRPFEHDDAARYLDLLAQRTALENQMSELEHKYRFESGGLKSAVEQAINDEHARRAGQDAEGARPEELGGTNP